MIIRDGLVAAAGCVLPLSDSNRLSSDLGTRHRAGVGMSEASDAVVVIVSEETGTISVAVGGMLKRHLAPQTLDKLLHNELCPANDGDEKQDLSLRLKQKLQPRRKPVSSILIAFEMCGFEAMPYFALAVAVSFTLSGYYGLYKSQKFIYSKIRTEFINRKAN